MDVLQVILLAFIQGLTEFLPVSSSAHVLLVSIFIDHTEPPVVFVTALHMGTLLAVLYYFRRELILMIKDGILSCLGRGQTQYSRLMWALIGGTVPVALTGLLLNQYISDYLRTPLVIAIAMIIFALLLGIADKRAVKTRDEYSLGWKDILLIGVAQVFALIPGASRSGTTMMAGLMVGLTREASARFSFLLSIPVIVLAGGYEASQLSVLDWATADLKLFGLGILIAAGVGLACIHVFLKLITRIGMMPFVIYRIILGVVLLILFW